MGINFKNYTFSYDTIQCNKNIITYYSNFEFLEDYGFGAEYLYLYIYIYIKKL